MTYLSGISILRILIFCLSAVFFVLAGFITLVALRIPTGSPPPKDSSIILKSDKPLLREEDISAILQQLAKEQETNRALQKELETTAAKTESKQPKVLLVLSGGDFLPGQVQLSSPAIKSVEALIPGILELPNYRVSIEGHTDKTPVKPSPGKKYTDNMELSYLRAKTVALILTRKGVAFDRISAIGYGDAKPVAPNDSDQGKSANRRVEIKLVQEKP